MKSMAKHVNKLVVISVTCALITSCAKTNLEPRAKRENLNPPNKSEILVTKNSAGEFVGKMISKTTDYEFRNNQQVHFFIVKAFDHNGDSISTKNATMDLLFNNTERPPASLNCKSVDEIPEGKVVPNGKEITTTNNGKGKFKLKLTKEKHKKDKACYQFDIKLTLNNKNVTIDPWIRIRRNQNN